VHPHSREVFISLTHKEQSADPLAAAFTWEPFLLAGEAKGAKNLA